MPVSDDKQIEILHDHYKETFARLLEVEKSRDRLFLWVIALFALLILEIGYPASVGGSLGKLTVGVVDIDLSPVPLAELLNATWVLTLAIALRYFQVSILVTRQYPYLHSLEKAISPALGGEFSQSDEAIIPLRPHGNVYQREGKVYLSEYPLLLDVAWFAYVILFPLILSVATIGLAYWEFTQLPYSLFHRGFDVVMAFALLCFLILYRVQPYVASRWVKLRTKRKTKQSTTAEPKKARR